MKTQNKPTGWTAMNQWNKNEKLRKRKKIVFRFAELIQACTEAERGQCIAAAERILRSINSMKSSPLRH